MQPAEDSLRGFYYFVYVALMRTDCWERPSVGSPVQSYTVHGATHHACEFPHRVRPRQAVGSHSKCLQIFFVLFNESRGCIDKVIQISNWKQYFRCFA